MGESSFGRGFGRGAGGVSGCVVALIVIFFVLPVVGGILFCGFSMLIGGAASVAAPEPPSDEETQSSPTAESGPETETDCGRSFGGRDALGNERPVDWPEWRCAPPYPPGACLSRSEYTDGTGCPGRLRCCPPLVAP